ncbi:MAG TPA: hypothetical protein VKF14_06280 [Candidatus Dormibacteraeota bacterium]|nr:hypothetical protein [Candidatus Dormibacteraeota bacterium]
MATTNRRTRMMADVRSALEAADRAAVGVLAVWSSKHQRAVAYAVTPYVSSGRLVITSTLAYLTKVRNLVLDPRLSVLVGGYRFEGVAKVRLDPDGSEFVETLLDQEIRKYPPTGWYARVPGHRRLLRWYFGRAIIQLEATSVEEVPGSDMWTIVVGDREAAGPPLIEPVAAPPAAAESFRPQPARSEAKLPDGAALILGHAEPKSWDLRQVRYSGRIVDGLFTVRRRTGRLDQRAEARGWLEFIRYSGLMNAAGLAAVAELRRLQQTTAR